MKTNVKKLTSVLLAVLMLFSMCSVLAVSAADAQDAVGAGLKVTGSSNYCNASAAVTVDKNGTATVSFSTPAALKMVNVQWGMNYDKTKLELTNCKAFNDGMLINTNAASYNVRGSVSNGETPFEIAADTAIMTFTFKAIGEGETNVYFYMEDLTQRTADGKDEIIVDNGVIASGPSLTVQANSNFFADQTKVFDDVTRFTDKNGNMYVTVAYKLYAKDMYIINLDIASLTYDPAVLEWQDDNSFFAFAAEQNMSPGTVHLLKAGEITANYTGVKPAAKAYDGTDPVTAVKATFKVLNKNAGNTTVNCTVDTMSLCDASEAYPYMKYLAIDKMVVNNANKAKATYTTDIAADELILIGDVNNDGKVNVNDATDLQRYLAEYISGSTLNLKVADVNRDGRINVDDVTAIQRICAA